MYLRMEKILVVVENLTETMEAYEAYGFGPFTEIEEREGLYRKACFTQNTDGSDVVFEIIQPLDAESGYSRFLAKYGRGVYNILFEQNPEYNNVIQTMTQEV